MERVQWTAPAKAKTPRQRDPELTEHLATLVESAEAAIIAAAKIAAWWRQHTAVKPPESNGETTP